MVYLRATQKLLRRLRPTEVDGDLSGAALGDWFANRLIVDRRPLLLLVSGTSLLPIIEPACDVRLLPQRLPLLVGERLQRLGIGKNLIDLEVEAMERVVVARTNDRSVVGTMVDFARAVPYHLPEDVRWGTTELYEAEAKLAVTPCRCSSRNTVFPDREAVTQLVARWAN